MIVDRPLASTSLLGYKLKIPHALPLMHECTTSFLIEHAHRDIICYSHTC